MCSTCLSREVRLKAKKNKNDCNTSTLTECLHVYQTIQETPYGLVLVQPWESHAEVDYPLSVSHVGCKQLQ